MTAIDERFITLVRLRDPLRADTLQALLETEGIPTLLPGRVTGATMHLQPASEIFLQVPESQAERARELIASIDDPKAELVEPVPASETVPERRRMTAAAASLILTFGTGHFYAREHWSGFVLALAEISAFLVFLRSAEIKWILAIAPVVMIDLAGSLVAVGRFRRGESLPTFQQILRTGALVVFLFAFVALLTLPMSPAS